MRRQYKYNHRTDNNQFEKKDLITRLGNNRPSSWSTNRGEETRPKAKARTTDVTQSFCREHEETDI
jgi:hypothetical protein